MARTAEENRIHDVLPAVPGARTNRLKLSVCRPRPRELGANPRRSTPRSSSGRRPGPRVRRQRCRPRKWVGRVSRDPGAFRYQLSRTSSIRSATAAIVPVPPGTSRRTRGHRPRAAWRSPGPERAAARPGSLDVPAPHLVMDEQVGEHLVRQAFANDVLPPVALGLQEVGPIFAYSWIVFGTSPQTRMYQSVSAARSAFVISGVE